MIKSVRHGFVSVAFIDESESFVNKRRILVCKVIVEFRSLLIVVMGLDISEAEED